MAWKKDLTRLVGGSAFLVLAAGALGAGCVNEADPLPPDPLATQGGFCQKLAETVCNDTVVGNCYGSVASDLENDRASCRAAAEEKFCNPESKVYRAVNAQGCIDAYGAAYGDAALEQTETDNIETACHPTLSGVGRQGDSCEITSDCNGSDGLECVGPAGGDHECQVPVEVMGGADCDGAADVCIEGFYCNADSSCLQEQGDGEACGDTQPCDDESFCQSDLCVAKFGNAEQCEDPEQCTGGFCDIDEGDTQGSCVARLTLSPNSQACEPFKP